MYITCHWHSMGRDIRPVQWHFRILQELMRRRKQEGIQQAPCLCAHMPSCVLIRMRYGGIHCNTNSFKIKSKTQCPNANLMLQVSQHLCMSGQLSHIKSSQNSLN